jgi:ankyrin repeat protein
MNLNRRTENYAEAMLIAMQKGKFHEINSMLKNGGLNVNIRHGSAQQTALAVAASNGQNRAVKYLIRKGAIINSRDRLGMTPLMRAAVHGSVSVVKSLLDAGANKNAQSNSGSTPLMYAVSWYKKEYKNDKNYEDVIRLLINRGARINIKNNRGNQAINKANKNNNIIRLLIPPKITRFLQQREIGR